MRLEGLVRLEFCQGSFYVADAGYAEHPRPERCGMREAFAIPAEMFAHASELLSAPVRFKLFGMFEKDLKSG